MVPAECLGCGFRFAMREHIRAPVSCPQCKGGQIQAPVFYGEKKYREQRRRRKRAVAYFL